MDINSVLFPLFDEKKRGHWVIAILFQETFRHSQALI